MKLSERLTEAIAGGICQIGQVAILPQAGGAGHVLRHIDDGDTAADLLENHHGPAAARDISTWTEDGRYRFTKAEQSLKRGWQLHLADDAELLQALDLFYPAAVGLWLAQQDGRLEVEHLRDKLNRQTGMYRFARNLSDTGAQALVREVCGPANCCVKKILWQIDADTPLEDSEASRYDGIPGDRDRTRALPLLCREACNHFVAEARKASKAESDAKAEKVES
ncbi:DR2241 family protein [Luteolibacter flavescens]|uniref:DR2241 family protein n=1 Tax=Luteolibacter flavescens TaxID=1859460 RepID=A0ABT3FMY4_9BACT|nr:DR2241 family protein [Luteolibacter flavescens]MCW1884923.1 DR2241 family protein [Luteolibacter flavescens]